MLVKCDDNLWHGAVVLTCSSKTKCEVKLESSGKAKEVDLHWILPLGMFCACNQPASLFRRIAAEKKRYKCRSCIVFVGGDFLFAPSTQTTAKSQELVRTPLQIANARVRIPAPDMYQVYL